MLYFFQQALNGLHIGAIYALLAFGYALINGVLHRTNLAHGPLFAFGGQTAILFSVFGWQALWLTLPVTLAFGLAVSLAFALLASLILSRTVMEPLAARNPNTIVGATLGVGIVLGELGRIAAQTRDFWLPPLLARPVVFAAANGFQVTLTVLQIVNCTIAAATLAGAALLLSRSRAGRAWRAVSDDPRAAALCGVHVARVFRGAVISGGAAAWLGGVLAALYFGNVSFGTGMIFGLKILFVAAVGGYLAPGLAALGAAGFGLAESLWSGYFPIEWRDAWMFGLLVALLVLRPSGRREA